MKSRVHVLISGRVQGVWFRSSIKNKAEQLGIKGWVKNTFDGDVEAVFEGEENKINEILDWCHQGPPLSKVENIDITKQSVLDDYDQFSIKY